MAGQCRFLENLIATTCVAGFMSGALAQTPEVDQPSGTCYEVIAGRVDSQTEGVILVNRCNGRTWILVRTHVGYRWRPIPTADTQVAASPPSPPKARLPKLAAQNSPKCFTFQGRQYCE
jgi:hypothetical protein